MQVWLVAIRPFACEKKRFAQKFTDRQMDGRTDGRKDDGRRAIALAHSWNELINLKAETVDELVIWSQMSVRSFITIGCAFTKP